MLFRLEGTSIGGRWRIAELLGVGAEGAVYATSGLGEGEAPAAVKVPLLPYHRPAEISSSLLRSRRSALRTEARHLATSASPYMPANHGLYDFVNPLLDVNRGGAFTEPEPALVMELLPGHDMDLWLARVHRSGITKQALRRHLDNITVVLLEALKDIQERGFVYADLRPGNLRVTGHPLRGVRLMDAGSLVETGDASGNFPHVPHYLPPELFEQHYTRGQAIVPTAGVQAIMAGRTLFEVATGRVPIPAEPVDASALKSECVSALTADVVEGLFTGSFTSVAVALKYLERHGVRANALPRAVSPRPGIAATPAAAAQRSAAAPPSASRSVPPAADVGVAPPPQPPKPRPARRGLWRRLANLFVRRRGT